MAGYLTTHVLDIAQGRPAAGIALALWRLTIPMSEQGPTRDPGNLATAGGTERQLLVSTRTNTLGRTDAPLLAGEQMVVGIYELVFAVGDYFVQQGLTESLPPLLDIVPLRFIIRTPTEHYHIPLLTSPWAYSTYRGS
ncbi:5-hydroxyisourate hydrolase [Ktedonobacteria bacterium brp13]|nr:5-hydroxyisourate hydrolase [Ktedonobacteria bacterium brp13]